MKVMSSRKSFDSQVFQFIIICSLGTSAALKLPVHQPANLLPYGACDANDANITQKYAGFRCAICNNNQLIPNLAILLSKGSKSCVLDMPKSNDGPSVVIDLVETSDLPEPICLSGEDDHGYSWERKKDKGMGSTCEEKYAHVLKKKGWTESRGGTSLLATSPTSLHGGATEAMLQKQQIDAGEATGFHVGATEAMLEKQQIDVNVFETPTGKRHSAVIWPRNGTCTKEHKCMLHVHLHALFEFFRPMYLFCGNVPKYVTNDETCYNNLRSVVLVPQLGHEFLKENWNPDYVSKHASGNAFGKFLFPLLEHFLQTNRDFIDLDKVSIGGGSSGGNGAMWAALMRPDIFRLAIASDPCAPHFLTNPEAKKLIDNMPPANKRRLKKVILGRGDNAELGKKHHTVQTPYSMCMPHDHGLDMRAIAPLAQKVPVHIKVYKNLGHGIWGHLMNQWQDLHDVLLTGKKSDI